MEGNDDELPRFAKRPQHDIQNFSLTLERNLLKSEVVKYLHDKLAKRLNVSTVRVPWSKMKAEDIIHWPQDVDFKQIHNMNKHDLKKLYELAKEDQLDFSPEFLSRFKNMLHKNVVSRWSHEKNALRSDIVKYLHDKLVEKLNVSTFRVPWDQMKSEDIINWPPDVEFKQVHIMNIKDLKKLHELAKDDKLDFSAGFLHRFKDMSGDRDKIRSDFRKHMQDKLAKKLNRPSIKLPWSKMKAEDIINWPSGVDFKQAHRVNKHDLTKLHELAKQDKLDFSPEFLSRLQNMLQLKVVSQWSRDRDDLRTEVLKYLRTKLAKNLNVSRIKLPWSKMKAEDIINWPSDVEFIKVSQININDLKRLHNLIKEDKLDFSREFLRRLKLGKI